MQTSVPILLYHKIATIEPAEDVFRLSVSPEKFEQQMAFLYKNHYRCLSLAELWQYQASGQPAPKKAFAITFDDGYEDNYSEAYPILDRYGFTATIFIVTDFVGRMINWPGSQLSQFMGWSQIQQMSSGGISFGGHTKTHPNLTEIPLQQAMQEIGQSKQNLEEKLGQTIEFFAYPGGHQNAVLQQVTQECGYRGACGVDIGPSTPFNTWRIQLNTDDSLALFRLKVSGWFEWLKRVRQRSKTLWWATQLAGKSLNRVPE